MITLRRNRFFSKSTVLWVTFFSFFAGMIFCSVPSGMAQVAKGLSMAPVNPAFEKYMADKKAVGPLPELTAEGHALGYIPPPIKLPAVSQPKPLAMASLPAKYDLRTKNKLTAIRDQGQCGSCWAFATFGSLESALLPAQKTDFSEQDLNKNHGFDLPECEGGQHWMSTAYLARWSGPLKETDVPYPYAAAASAQKHVQEVTFLLPRADAKDNAAIKAAVMSSGAVMISYAMDEAFYNAAKFAYYCDQDNQTNHAVAVVGWDDGFKKSNFAPAIPPGDGAFIVRNSWGTGWGQAGYFYLSYYDKTFVPDAVFANAEPVANYSTVYQYDPLGLVTMIGTGEPTLWGANIFKATSAAKLKAVSFWTLSPNSSYEIYVYTNVTAGKPKSGKLASTKKGKIATAGYHTIVLKDTALTAGKSFSVVVKFTTPGWGYPLPIEGILEGYSSAATAHPGESFASMDGKTWFDLVAEPDFAAYQFNVCLKAFAKK